MKVIATSRSAQGTGASRRLRIAGRVPAIVYGGEATPASIELDHNTLYHALRKEAFHSSILELEVDGKGAEKVLLRDVQMHPFRQLVLHVDFQRISANTKIHVKVPLHFVNADLSPAVKMSAAVVSHVLTELDVTCLPGQLPEFIEVDLTTLVAGSSIHLNDIKLPDGVSAVTHENPVVVLAKVPAGAVEATATEAEKK
jgi:large subunit ribosomal protein L25